MFLLASSSLSRILAFNFMITSWYSAAEPHVLTSDCTKLQTPGKLSSPIKTTPFAKGVPWLSVSRNAKKNLDSIHEHPLIIYRLGNVSTSASKALIWEAKTIYAPPTIFRRFWLLKIGCEKKHVKSMKQQVEAWSIQPTVQQPSSFFFVCFSMPTTTWYSCFSFRYVVVSIVLPCFIIIS